MATGCDNYGHFCAITVNVMRDPPPHDAAFGQLHLAFMYFIAILITAFLLPVFRNFWGSTHGPLGKVVICLAFVFITYSSMCLAVFGMNYGFHPARLSASIDETNRDLRAGWAWIHGG